jgi:hypothetical protein
MKKARKQVTAGSPNTSGIPRAMVLTVSFVLSPVIGLCCHRRLADTSAKLDIGVEISGPHDFAVRGTRIRLLRPRVHRIFRPTFSDDRETPLFTGRKTRQEVPVICPSSQGNVLRQIGTTGKSRCFARNRQRGNVKVSSSFRGDASASNPESIGPRRCGSMDSGSAPGGASRNDV